MKKKLKILVLSSFAFVFLIISISFLCFLRVQSETYTSYTTETMPDIEVSCVIVPGAQITSFGPGYALENRLYAAFTIYQNTPVKIYLSGAYDTVIEKHEVDIMYDYMRFKKINPKDILLDYEGVSTIQTLKNAKTMVQDSPIVICTQRMYAPRTMYLANKLDLNASIMISDRSNYQYDTFKATLREYFACTKAVLQTLFH